MNSLLPKINHSILQVMSYLTTASWQPTINQNRSKIFLFASIILVAIFVSIIGLEMPEVIYSLSDQPNFNDKYWHPSHGLLLYVWMPLLAIAVCILILAPGLTLSLAINRLHDGFVGFLLQGLAYTIFGTTFLVAALGLYLGHPIIGLEFIGLLSSLSLCGIIAIWIVDHKSQIEWGVFDGRGRDILVSCFLPIITLVLLTPKFHWENMNGDGAHVYHAVLFFIHTNLPGWEGASGSTTLYPLEVILEVITGSWFFRLFGSTELSVRLPIFLGLAVLNLVILDFLRGKRDKDLGWPIILSIASTLLLYVFVLAYQTSYNPYFADIALPAAREPMLVVVLLGFIHFFRIKRPVWSAVMTLILCFTTPSAPVLIGLWMIAVFLTSETKPWTQLFWTAMGLICALAVVKSVPAALQTFGLIGDEAEFSARSIAKRLRYVSIFDIERLFYWILPLGIFPAIALIAWKQQGRFSQSLSILILLYVLFFYLQAYRILPHHFAPAMVLPLIVFWRLPLIRRKQGLFAVITLVGVVFSAVLSRPPNYFPHTNTQRFANSISYQQSNPGAVDATELAIVEATLCSAFPAYYSDEMANTHYAISAIAMNMYLSRGPSERQDFNYEIRQPNFPSLFKAPVKLAEHLGFCLYAKDEETYQTDKIQSEFVRSIGNQFYVVSRSKLFGTDYRIEKDKVWDLVKILDHAGVVVK